MSLVFSLILSIVNKQVWISLHQTLFCQKITNIMIWILLSKFVFACVYQISNLFRLQTITQMICCEPCHLYLQGSSCIEYRQLRMSVHQTIFCPKITYIMIWIRLSKLVVACFYQKSNLIRVQTITQMIFCEPCH